MIKPGEPWGGPASSPPELEVAGSDAALATAVASAPGALVRFRPDATSDLARAVGLRPGGTPDQAPAVDVPMDAIRYGDGRYGDGRYGDGLLACNLIVVGAPPDRLRWASGAPHLEVDVDGAPWFAGHATTVVVASGQFLRGADLVPRGHPGDGRLEVQVYELRRGERRAMRRRLVSGAHLPHPRIRSRVARTVVVRAAAPVALEVDGEARPAGPTLRAEVVPGAFRLLI